jgi:hypothetical protein
VLQPYELYKPNTDEIRAVRRLKNLSLLALSVLVMLLVLEFASRLIAPQDLSHPWMTVDSQGLVLNRAGAVATHRRGETVATYRINENHMRGQAPYPNIPSVLVVGDSFTFGWLVDNEDTVVSQLQKQADEALGPDKIRFLNAGTGGWGTASYLDYLTRYAGDIKPAAILVFANATDFNRSLQSGIYTVADGERSVTRSVHESSGSDTIKRFVTGLPLYQWLVGNSNLMQIFRLAILGAISSASGEALPGAEMLENNQTGVPEREVREFNISLLRELRSVADQQSVPLFVSTQYHWQYSPDVYDWLVPVMKELEVPFLAMQRDIAATTGGKVEGFFIKGDPHPTGAIYEILAEKTWSWLIPQLGGDVIDQ